MFGQLPLQVDGFKDIHESLEAATAQGEIETLNEGPQSKSCQEVICQICIKIDSLNMCSFNQCYVGSCK